MITPDIQLTKRAQKRFKNLKHQYGLEKWQFDLLVARQHHQCAICRKHTEKLHVDHDHGTSVVRGLLCVSCNTTLGVIEKHLELLPAMLQYLGIISPLIVGPDDDVETEGQESSSG